jgi:CheY-like chemotaxis protein
MSGILTEAADLQPRTRTQSDYIPPSKGEDEVASMITILLVEDDEADAYLIERALRNNTRVGEIIRAHDGEEALQILASAAIRPQLALIDLQMPRRDGFSLLLELKKLDAELVSVVLTSSRGGADAHRSFHRGARMFVSKPKEPQRMQAILNEVIRELE